VTTHAYRILRAAAGLLVLILLVYLGRIDLKILSHALDHPALLALAAGLLLASVPLAAFRWWLLTARLGFPMRFSWSLRTTFTSQFFNAFLPGAFGGDMVRVVLAYRAAQRGLSQLTFTIVVDRLCGLTALILLGLCVLPALPPRFHEPAYLLPWVAAGTALLAGAAVAVLWGERIASLLGRLPAPVGARLAHGAREVLAALRAYADRWLTLVWALMLSVLQFILVLSCIGVLGVAMSFDALSTAGYVVAGVGSLIANSLPLTPGGLGVGEAAFGQIAALLETVPSGASYANVFLAVRILSILINVLGFLSYLAQRSDLIGAPPVDADTSPVSQAGGGT
jgi:glycosyltransferase 2 family protein